MSRAIIGGAVAVMVLGLTAAAFFVTTSKLEGSIRTDIEQRVQTSRELLVQNAKLDGLSLLNRVEDLAGSEELLSALRAETTDVAAERVEQLFASFRSNSGGAAPPAIMALIDREGEVVVLHLGDQEVNLTNPSMWKKGDRLKYRALELAINPDPKQAHIISDIWNQDGKGLMKVGVAPVVEYRADGAEVQGAIMVAYSLSAVEARRQSGMVGGAVAFFEADQVAATSFTRPEKRQQEDTGKHGALAKVLADGVSKQTQTRGFTGPTDAVVDDANYVVAAGRMPRFTSKGEFPADYPEQAVGAMVLMSVDDANAPVGAARMGVLLLGAGAIIIMLIALWLLGRRVTAQTDAVESGLNEIINGNLDYAFRPVGDELDGVANGLNVMLARLLGRPEPGEEEYDEDGNIIQPGRLDFDTDLSDKDAEAVQLAQEPDADYYKRIFDEYVNALAETGRDTDGVTFDGFVTKLRLNETNLKAKYQCSAIRFRVVAKDGKVSLKPVPIV